LSSLSFHNINDIHLAGSLILMASERCFLFFQKLKIFQKGTISVEKETNVIVSDYFKVFDEYHSYDII